MPVRQDLAIAESQLRDYRERLGKPFAHEHYLSEFTSLRDQLKAGLSATAHDASNENGPTVSELADRVKALKAANTIETTPQRVQSKQATAEEPITARIRKRQEALIAETPAQEADESAADAMSFRERILRERQQNAEGEGQSPS